MAGEDPTGGFDKDEVVENLRAAMLMGLPEDVDRRPVFLFPRERTYSQPDQAGQPWDWTDTPATDSNDEPGEPRTVLCGEADDEVLCTWEAAGGRGGTQANETAFGNFDTERLVFTFIGEDAEKIEGFDRVIVNGNTYRYQFEEPSIGLFEMEVRTFVVSAQDES